MQGGQPSAAPPAAYLLATLPPVTYTVTFELSGFNPLKREQVVVQVARTTRLDVEMGVGALQETVTVSGASPVVDVSSTVTQTNITKDLYEAIPTGRNPWVMAGLVPGVVTGRLDVGGTEGMQQYNLEAFGSADSQKSFSIDGLKTNWAGGSGGATMQYYGFEMYEEYNMQTASGTAESDVSGVYMNMVTKSGGNRFTQRPQLLFHERRAAGRRTSTTSCRRRLGPGPGAANRRGGQSDRHLLRLELDARRPDQARQGVVLRRHALVAAGPVPDRRAQSGRLAGHRRQSDPRTSWAR